MSKLKLSGNLHLGKQELDFMLQSSEDGYNSIVSGGVLLINGSELRIDKTGANELTLRKGKGIDGKGQTITVVDDTILQPIVNDGLDRYIFIKYKYETIEEGTVSVQSDGVLVGTGTKFTQRLRGAGNYPMKIVFENSATNLDEYIIQSVQNDELAALNVAGGVLTAESELKYKVVGSFAAGVTVPDSSKFPFQSDGYEIIVQTSSTPPENSLLLANVRVIAGTVQVSDLRYRNVFGIKTKNVTKENYTIGIEQISYPTLNESGATNKVRVGWGLMVDSWNNNNGTLTLSHQGHGGAAEWYGFSKFSDGDLDGWQVVFENGDVLLVKSSIAVGIQLELELEYGNIPLGGNIVIVPNCDSIQLRVSTEDSPTDRIYTFDTLSRYATIDIIANKESRMFYRHLDRFGCSTERWINDGKYTHEDLGAVSGTVQFGKFTPKKLKSVSDKIPVGTLLPFAGVITDIPFGWALADGSNGTFDLRDKFVLGYNQLSDIGTNPSELVMTSSTPPASSKQSFITAFIQKIA